MDPSDGDAVISAQVASNYKAELATGKHRRGEVLSAADKNFRINKLKAYSLTLSTQFRLVLNTKLDKYTADLKQHMTSETDRVMDAMTENHEEAMGASSEIKKDTDVVKGILTGKETDPQPDQSDAERLKQLRITMRAMQNEANDLKDREAVRKTNEKFKASTSLHEASTTAGLVASGSADAMGVDPEASVHEQIAVYRSQCKEQLAAGLKVIKANAKANTKAPAEADTSTPPSKRQRTSGPCTFVYKKSNKTAGIAKGDICGKVNCTKHSRMMKQQEANVQEDAKDKKDHEEEANVQEDAKDKKAHDEGAYEAALSRLPSFSLSPEPEVEQGEEEDVHELAKQLGLHSSSEEDKEEKNEEHQQKEFGLPIASPLPSSASSTEADKGKDTEEDHRDDFEKEFDRHMEDFA